MKSLDLALRSLAETDDIKSALQYHFNTLNAKQRSLAASKRFKKRQVFSILQIRKKTNHVLGKRIGASLTKDINISSGKSSAYALCVSICFDAGARTHPCQSAQLHYIKLYNSFSVDLRQTWELEKLETIECLLENVGVFSLQFERDDQPAVWTVRSKEIENDLNEFLWSICALCVNEYQKLPRLVRLNPIELDEYAKSRDLFMKYNLKPLDLTAFIHQATASNNEIPGSGENSQLTTLQSLTTSKDSKSLNSNLHLSPAENEELIAFFASIKWGECHVDQIENEWKRRMRELEDENINFLLSFESDYLQAASGSKLGDASTILTQSSKPVTPVDRILHSIEVFEKHIAGCKSWMKESDTEMAQVSRNMVDFESLNNQLEVHFKNSVALQITLENLLRSTTVSEDEMSLLRSQSDFFTCQFSTLTEITQSTKQTVEAELKPILEALQSVNGAFQSCMSFPACNMSAFRNRREELRAVVHALSAHIAASFQVYLQRLMKAWKTKQPSLTADPSSISQIRSSHDTSSALDGITISQKHSTTSSRHSQFGTSSVSEKGLHVNWSFTNEIFHTAITMYKPLFAAIGRVDANGLNAIQDIYTKNVSQVYAEHFQYIIRCMREHFAKTNAQKSLQSWSFHHSSSQVHDVMSASELFQLALDHLSPLLLREERFICSVLLNQNVSCQSDNREIDGPASESSHFVMDSIFEKSIKRFIDFGELAASKSILEALGLLTLINSRLSVCQAQSEYLQSILLQLQLQIKRILSKFVDEEESWLHAQHPDTKIAGILKPVQKMIVRPYYLQNIASELTHMDADTTQGIVEILKEFVDGTADDPTPISILNRIVASLLQWLDRIAEQKPKYTELVKLENYYYIHEKFHAMQLDPGHSLSPFVGHLQSRFDESLIRYVDSVWKVELDQLPPLMTQLNELLETVPTQEIEFHMSRQEAMKYFTNLRQNFEKIHIHKLYETVTKHLHSSPKLLPIVWSKLIEHAYTQFIMYDRIGTQCYQHRIEPSPQVAKEMMQKMASGHH